MEGGCLCGGIRYRLASEPTDAGWCHCRTCQLNSGSPAMAFATVPVADFVLLAGADLVGSVASSETGERRFCTHCGTPLLMQDKGATTVDFSLATLDEPGRVRPGFHIFYESRIGWAEAGDDLPRHPRSRRESGSA
ncbi:GFA family protein [Sphingomonas sp. HITSZ_GF]|uniref:GFA family protein n=1 Tax=Sphingomonas sp. HITSZ_GF TaxID=3037247 RepID=UPI00240CF50A|nr:GFA family protein [Sphingomonas sp. HITSZ_GF]MDG2532458.1 GFA family protein [Sphingomonas sp. HITSZ_GF]